MRAQINPLSYPEISIFGFPGLVTFAGLGPSITHSKAGAEFVLSSATLRQGNGSRLTLVVFKLSS